MTSPRTLSVAEFRARIDALVDAGSFLEVGGLAGPHRDNPWNAAIEAPSDGNVVGMGLIEGRPALVWSLYDDPRVERLLEALLSWLQIDAPPGRMEDAILTALLDAGAGIEVPARGQIINVSLRGTNLLNRRYRDYNSLLRYFADEPGWGLQLRVSMEFAVRAAASSSS